MNPFHLSHVPFNFPHAQTKSLLSLTSSDQKSERPNSTLLAGSLMDKGFIKILSGWTKRGRLEFCLGADMGCSGVRYVLQDFLDPTRSLILPHAKASCALEVYESMDTLKSTLGKHFPDFLCRGTVFASAGLRQGDSVLLENWVGPKAERTIKPSRFPPELYPKGHSILMNDLEAAAHGLCSMSESGILDEYFVQMAGPKGPVLSDRTAFMGMGSGLGTAIIIRNRRNRIPVVLSTEFGYLQAAQPGHRSPKYKCDSEIMEKTANHFYAGELMPCYEDLASGRGLRFLYQQMTGRDVDGKTVARYAKEGEREAAEALLHHYRFFYKYASTVARTMQCGSVVMGLSNQVMNHWFVAAHHKDLVREFLDSPNRIPTTHIRLFTQHRDINFNLAGAAWMADFIARNPITSLPPT